MADKVIFLSLTPDSGLIPFKHKTYFDQNNITCEYWDLRYLAQHERSTELKPIFTPYDDVPVLNPQIEELEKYVKENADSVFIAGYRITRHNRILFKLFKKYNVKYILLINTNTFFHLKSGEIRRKFTQNGNISYLLELTLRKFQKTYNNLAIDIQRPYLTVCGSINDKIISNFPEPRGGVTYIHNHNYEKLLPMLSQPKEEKYVVFIDQYLPWHNETQKFNKWKMNPETYYSKIAQILNQFAKNLGKEAIIATHPKSEKGKIEPFVGNIKVVYGETPNAILTSALCLLHSSTSIDHVVLLGKKMVFVLCDEVLNSPIEIGTQLMANEFHKPVLIIEDYLKNSMFDIVHYSKIDEQYYHKYINHNIKAGNNINIPYWQYIADKIKNIAQ
jgi:hypothetical protein